MPKKSKLINFKGSQELNDRLLLASSLVDRPYSQLIREGINEKLDKLAKKYPQLRDGTESAALNP